jgi:mannose-6-phosphate isomerase-like protein (cupin superfamily)
MRLLPLLLAACCLPGAEIRDVLKNTDIEALFRRAKADQALHERPNYAVWLKVLEGKPGSEQTNPGSDDILWIRGGTARLRIADRQYEIGAGDMVHIPRNTPHQLDPGRSGLEYLAIRIFPSGESQPPRPGIRPAARRMPDVVKKSEIDATIAKYDSNQPLHTSPGYTMNYVIYTAKKGPYEAHHGCVDVYFLQRGTATAHLGGEITDAKEEIPGEIRGAGVKGTRTYSIGPGDLVVIPRNGVHHMDPGSGKLAYVLLKIWAE